MRTYIIITSHFKDIQIPDLPEQRIKSAIYYISI